MIEENELQKTQSVLWWCQRGCGNFLVCFRNASKQVCQLLDRRVEKYTGYIPAWSLKKLNHVFVFCHNIHEVSISATCQFFPCADFFLSQPTHYVCCCCFTALTLEQEDRTDRHQTDALCFPLWIWPAICLQSHWRQIAGQIHNGKHKASVWCLSVLSSCLLAFLKQTKNCHILSDTITTHSVSSIIHFLLSLYSL